MPKKKTTTKKADSKKMVSDTPVKLKKIPAEEIGAAVVKPMKEVKEIPVIAEEVQMAKEMAEEVKNRVVRSESPRFPFMERDVNVEAEDIIQLNAFSGESVTLCLTSLKSGFAISKLVNFINGKASAVEVAELFESVIMEVKTDQL